MPKPTASLGAPVNRGPIKSQYPTQRRASSDSVAKWRYYESMKREFTASATTSAEYEQAVRRAAQIAGV